MSAKESLLRFFISQEARQVLLSSRFDTHPVFFMARIKPTQTSNYPSTLSTLTEATNLHWDVRTSLANIKEHSTGMAGLTTETEFFFKKSRLLSTRVGKEWMDGRSVLLNQPIKYTRPWNHLIPFSELSNDNFLPF